MEATEDNLKAAASATPVKLEKVSGNSSKEIRRDKTVRVRFMYNEMALYAT